MDIEEIILWKEEEAKTNGWDDRHKLVSYFDWLIAEVEQLQEFEKEFPAILYMQAYDKAEKKVAKSCAEICDRTEEDGIYGERSARAIRKEFNLEDK